jgi:hypothetical protein
MLDDNFIFQLFKVILTVQFSQVKRSGMSQTTNRCLPLIPDNRLHRSSASDNMPDDTLL